MKYVTITAKDYDEALQKAKNQFGPGIRIHSRRDVVAKGGFLWMSKRNYVEITCYLADPETSAGKDGSEDILRETTVGNTDGTMDGKGSQIATESESPDGSKTPGLVTAAPAEDALAPLFDHAEQLLLLNDFSKPFIGEVLPLLRKSLEEREDGIPTREEFELMLVDKIVSLVRVDHETQLHPPRIFVLLGPTGIGKTTTIAKIAALYGLQRLAEFRRKVFIITIDSFRVGAFEQISSFGQSLGIPVERVTDEQDFYRALDTASDADLILVDTIGKSPRDNELAVQMKALLSVPKREEARFFLAVSASMKEQDLERTLDQYASYGIFSVIVTKTDETESVGNILSLCRKRDLPLLFFTDGQHVPKDIHKASAATMLSLLKGFSLDFANLWNNQVSASEPTEL